jgi:tRNA threonylcarbamoyladenosine biosynthesis protein TsaE
MSSKLLAMVVLESSSPEETERLAARLAAHLRAGDLVTVAGELGAGKTTFVRGAARMLGVAGSVTSPTYAIGHRYPADPDVSHLDLYRFESMSEADWGDLEGYFEDAITFVEHRLIEVESPKKSLEIALSEPC